MQAEYYPPKEDVVCQNEAPTDLYIVVTGAVVGTSDSCTLTPKEMFYTSLNLKFSSLMAGLD